MWNEFKTIKYYVIRHRLFLEILLMSLFGEYLDSTIQIFSPKKQSTSLNPTKNKQEVNCWKDAMHLDPSFIKTGFM